MALDEGRTCVSLSCSRTGRRMRRPRPKIFKRGIDRDTEGAVDWKRSRPGEASGVTDVSLSPHPCSPVCCPSRSYPSNNPRDPRSITAHVPCLHSRTYDLRPASVRARFAPELRLTNIIDSPAAAVTLEAVAGSHPTSLLPSPRTNEIVRPRYKCLMRDRLGLFDQQLTSFDSGFGSECRRPRLHPLNEPVKRETIALERDTRGGVM
jgi:hypothetical protein